jgi:hypothetical protein
MKLKNTMETVRIIVPAKIRTGHLPNTNQKRYRLIDLFCYINVRMAISGRAHEIHDTTKSIMFTGALNSTALPYCDEG